MVGADLDGDGLQDALFNSTGTLDYLPGATPTMPQPYVPMGSGAASSGMFVADMDLDGDADVVVLNSTGGSCAIYENLGQGDLWNKRTSASGLNAVKGLFDRDGDGDQDLIVQVGVATSVMTNLGAFSFSAPVLVEATNSLVLPWDPDNNGVGDLLMQRSNALYHYANNGSGTFAAPVSLLTGVPNVGTLADMDGDSDLDLVTLSTSGVSWYPRTGTTQFSAGVSLLSGTSFSSGNTSQRVLDVDGDGDKDVVISVPASIGTTYLRNNGSGSFTYVGYLLGTINGNAGHVMMDLDLDGDRDMLYIDNSGKVYWQEDRDGPGFDVGIVHSGAGVSATPVHADLDGDGLIDVLVRSGDAYRWCRNTGGGIFAAPIVLAQNATGNDRFADADGDGDDDLFTWTYTGNMTTVSWKPNTGNGVFGASTTIFSASGYLPFDLVADLEGDGDPDVLANEGNNLHRFYLNNGNGSFASSSLTITALGPFQRLLDMDGDGDLDPCYAIQTDNDQTFRHGFARNNAGTSFTLVSGSINMFQPSYTSGDGAFLDVDRDGLKDVVYHSLLNTGGTVQNLVWVRRSVVGFESQVRTLYSNTFAGNINLSSGMHNAADVDHDGDADLIVGPWLFINLGPGMFLFRQQLTDPSIISVSLVPGDLDADGLTDLTIWSNAEEVRWTQFEAENGRLGATHVLIDSKPGALKQLLDFDQDGDTDILASTSWYENDGTGLFSAHPIGHLYAPLSTDGGFIAHLATDLDGDLDLDLVVGDPPYYQLGWMERLPGGAFAAPRSIAPINTGTAVCAGDLDGDGDKDIMLKPVSSGSSSKWLRNLGGGAFQVVSMGTAYYADKLGDYDLDGDLDMIGYYRTTAWYFALLKNNGSGVFTVATYYGNNFYQPAGTFADLDGDSDLDHVYCMQSCYWSANDGAGNIPVAHTALLAGGGNFFSVECADADGDGDKDVFALGHQNYQRLNNGNGASFQPMPNINMPSGGLSYVHTLAADMNGDGKLDIVGDGGDRIWIALATGASCPLNVTVLLDGPYRSTTGSCGDGLRTGNLLPLTEPYTALGYAHVGGGGGETIARNAWMCRVRTPWWIGWYWSCAMPPRPLRASARAAHCCNAMAASWMWTAFHRCSSMCLPATTVWRSSTGTTCP